MKDTIKIYQVNSGNIITEKEELSNLFGVTKFEDLEVHKALEGSHMIAIQGNPSKKKFIVDGKVMKVTKRINGIPVQVIDDEGNLVELVGKFIKAYYALKELWQAIKKLF